MTNSLLNRKGKAIKTAGILLISGSDIYWVNAGIINKLRKHDQKL
jgi:hypothetical protein